MLSSNLLAWIFDTNRLIGTNYKDWLWNLRIILNFEKLIHVLDQKMSMLSARPSLDQWAVIDKWMDEDNKARCYQKRYQAFQTTWQSFQSGDSFDNLIVCEQGSWLDILYTWLLQNWRTPWWLAWGGTAHLGAYVWQPPQWFDAWPPHP